LSVVSVSVRPPDKRDLCSSDSSRGRDHLFDENETDLMAEPPSWIALEQA
jgi:hypothetical protein